MKLSLICATLNRTKELEKLILSILKQSNKKDIEFIVVDQNKDDRVENVLKPFKKELKIKHLRSETGLSRARNMGLKAATSEIVAFPDDDCWYAEGTLPEVINYFEENKETTGLSGICYDFRLDRPYGRAGKKEGWINKNNVWMRGSSASLFVRLDFLFCDDIYFNESLGLGTFFHSGEETDFVLRIISQGGKIFYSPQIKIGHPYKKEHMDQAMIDRGYQYGLGFGHVLRKHNYPKWFVLFVLSVSIFGILSSVIKFKSNWIRYHFNTLKGRFAGYTILFEK